MQPYSYNNPIFKAQRRVDGAIGKLQAVWSILTSQRECIEKEVIFKDVDKFCLFIGYPRSGHSLVGSLIDAHPNAVIGHELDVFWYVKLRCSKFQIYCQILKNAKRYVETGSEWTDYSYQVPNQWQGNFRRILLMGDKKGGGTVFWLRKDPLLLSKLSNILNVQIKFIHVIRNPFDNITTICKRNRFTLQKSIDYYFSMTDTVINVKKSILAEDFLDIKHEAFIQEPGFMLEKICKFIDLETSQDYIRDCTSILYKKPHKSRHEIPWSKKLISFVNERIENFSHLAEYNFEN